MKILLKREGKYLNQQPKKKSTFMDKTTKFNKQVNIMKWKAEK